MDRVSGTTAGSAEPEGQDIPLLVTLGISGHRKPKQLGDIARLTSRMKEQLRSIRSGLREANGAVSFLMISPLADGADRLFVRAVWEVEPEARLLVPLPFDKEAYEKSFFSEESVQEFRGILEHPNCLEWFVLPDSCEDEYLEVGRYVVDHSDIMFFLFEGNDFAEAPLDGGTGSVLRYARYDVNRGAAGWSVDTGDTEADRPSHQGGICYLFNTRDETVTVMLPGVEATTTPEALDPEVFRNQNVHHLKRVSARPDDGADPEDTLGRLKALQQRRFDDTASRCQRRFDAQNSIVIALAFCMSSVVLLDWFSGGNHVFERLGVLRYVINWDSLALAGLLAIVVIVLRFRNRHFLEDWMESRYLAEELRYASEYLQAGVPFSSVFQKVIDEPMPVKLIRIWQSIYFQAHLGHRGHGFEQPPAAELKRMLLDRSGLVADQLIWHHRRSKQKWDLDRRHRQLRNLWFLLSGSAAAMAIGAVAFDAESAQFAGFSLANLLDLLSSMSSLLLAGVAAMSQVKEHGKIASRYLYTRMQLADLYKGIHFIEYRDEDRMRWALQQSVLEAARILKMTTHAWIYTMQDKDPHWS